MKIPILQIRKNKNGTLYMYKIRDINHDGFLKASKPSEICKLIREEFSIHELADEEVYALFLTNKCNVKAIVRLSHGGADQAYFYSQSLYRQALLCGAAGIVLVHNHPSGDSTPSSADIEMTQSIKEGCVLLGLKLFDHIIIGDQDRSLMQEGYL